MASEMTTAEMVKWLRDNEYPGSVANAIADRLEALESLYAKAWAECEAWRRWGYATASGRAHDAARKEAGL